MMIKEVSSCSTKLRGPILPIVALLNATAKALYWVALDHAAYQITVIATYDSGEHGTVISHFKSNLHRAQRRQHQIADLLLWTTNKQHRPFCRRNRHTVGRMGPLTSHLQEDFAIIDLAVCHIHSIHTLAQLSVVSKHCRAICAAHATHQLQALLLPALRQAAVVPASPLHQQHMSNIKWLCSVAGKEAFAAASAAVLTVPHVPLAAVRLLTAAGVRMTSAGVMKAAMYQLPGAEAWAYACWPPQQMVACSSLATQLRSSFEMLQEAAEAAAAAAGVPMAVGAAVAAEQRAFMLLELLPHCAGSKHVCGSLLVLHLFI
jgi:hypothetical protein